VAQAIFLLHLSRCSPQRLSSVHRTLVDACRTLFVWTFQLLLYYTTGSLPDHFGEPWTPYSWSVPDGESPNTRRPFKAAAFSRTLGFPFGVNASLCPRLADFHFARLRWRAARVRCGMTLLATGLRSAPRLLICPPLPLPLSSPFSCSPLLVRPQRFIQVKSFLFSQVLGFAFLVTGTLTYNHVIALEYFFGPAWGPAPAAPASAAPAPTKEEEKAPLLAEESGCLFPLNSLNTAAHARFLRCPTKATTSGAASSVTGGLKLRAGCSCACKIIRVA